MKSYNGTFLNHPLVPSTPKREIGGVQPLAATSGKISLDCPICGIGFERYACWAKRKKICYCSKACADEAKRRPVEVSCVVCSGVFFSTPAEVSRKRIVTCSVACRSIHRRSLVFAGVLLKDAKPPLRDEKNSTAKLTAAQVTEIGTSAEQTAVLVKRYSVSATTIRNIRRQQRNKVAE